MSIIKFRTDSWRNRIEVVVCEKETASFVTIRNPSVHGGHYESREKKVTDSHRYFSTWEEARAHLEKHAQREVERCENELTRAKRRLVEAKYPMPPEEKI